MNMRVRYLKHLAPVVPAVLCLALFTGWIDPYRDRVKEGNEAYHKNDFKKAEEAYRAASRYAPGKKEARKLRFNMGDVRYMMGDFAGALDEFRASLKSEDRSVQGKALFNAGNAHLKSGNPAEAARSYIDSLKLNPDYAPAKKNLEYLLRAKNPPGGEGEKKRDRGGGGDGKQKDRGGDVDGQRREAEGASKPAVKPGSHMSRDQVMNILKSMQQKPVRRQKGAGADERVLEKPW